MDDEWLAVDVFRREMAAVLSPIVERKDKRILFITLLYGFFQQEKEWTLEILLNIFYKS